MGDVDFLILLFKCFDNKSTVLHRLYVPILLALVGHTYLLNKTPPQRKHTHISHDRHTEKFTKLSNILDYR